MVYNVGPDFSVEAVSSRPLCAISILWPPMASRTSFESEPQPSEHWLVAPGRDHRLVAPD